MDGMLGNERAPLQDDQDCDYGHYRTSSSSQNLNVTPSSILTSILVKRVRINKDYKNYFNATVLGEVNTEHRGGEGYLVEDEFYPALHTLLTGRRYWGLTFQFQGRSSFMRAFCELWGLLTNTLHHGAREVAISLYDLERIGGFTKLIIFIMTSGLTIFTENTWFTSRTSKKEKVESRKRSPLCISHQE
ncbi:hypothetical protein Cgig2_000003 [Carnegiea gigantea]|uniref:Uncharacterized protein n=1 Tax=Carnegiea gigantea TaxID=171969 RepID=A0A9Q1JVP7_9CARY|nr:hypothetical protein Cgig2_000003 [Carnegiea gigantea]